MKTETTKATETTTPEWTEVQARLLASYTVQMNEDPKTAIEIAIERYADELSGMTEGQIGDECESLGIDQ